MKSIFRETKVEIQNRQIHVVVTGNVDSIKNNPFVLYIPGGPGCSFKGDMPFINELLTRAQNKQASSCNFIFFDPLGAGDSDDAKDRETEYTVENFAEIAAQVVEQVKTSLELEKMDLRVLGKSFGGMTAMCLPAIRPEWLEKNAPISLQLIVPQSFCNGWNTIHATSGLIDQHFNKRPDYLKIRQAVLDELEFETPDLRTILQNVFAQAPLFSREGEKTMDSFSGKLLQNHPQFVVGLLNFLQPIIRSENLQASIATLNMNFLQAYHFQKRQYNGFRVDQLVKKHRDLYSSIPICFLSGAEDLICHPSQTVELIQPEFDNMASVVFNSRHHIYSDRPEVYDTLLDLLFNTTVNELALKQLHETKAQDGVFPISNYNIPVSFQEKLTPLRNDNSTETMVNQLTNGQIKKQSPLPAVQPQSGSPLFLSEKQKKHSEVIGYVPKL